MGGLTLADTGAGREHLSSVTVRGKALGQGPVLLEWAKQVAPSGAEALGSGPEQSSYITAPGCVFL